MRRGRRGVRIEALDGPTTEGSAELETTGVGTKGSTAVVVLTAAVTDSAVAVPPPTSPEVSN